MAMVIDLIADELQKFTEHVSKILHDEDSRECFQQMELDW